MPKEKSDMGQVCLRAAELSMHDYEAVLLDRNLIGDPQQYLTAAQTNLSLAKRHGADITEAYQRLERLREILK